ncbi:MAG TPA: DMT family transporter [Bryobacteraceae bacterium]|nr:DMT family transporter [Bryobacteraceae bacterium]
MTQPALRYRALLLAAAVLFSTGGAAIKSATLTGWQIACFRSAVAAAVLLLVLPEARRGWRWRIVPVAAAYAATLITFVLANRLTTGADAIFLQSTAPLYLLLLGPVLLGEPARRADFLYIAAVLAGMAVFFLGSEPALETAPNPAKGNLIAASSALAYALMLAGLRWLARRGNRDAAVATVALGNVLASVATLPLALPVAAGAGAGTGHNLAIILYLGVVQIGVAYFCLTRAMGHVPALQAATLLMAEPALNPLWTWLVRGERPGAWPLAGGAVILGATLANTWRQSKEETR